ncbi:expressed protein [Echinococcus multilocularis]|uniref:Expressed protein n=1 Tax=Echinococcus multilocularis TaxID=6211 RepID=A0A068Y1F5_ECHMU|nr:expressed protein [Echinococcus multilocularis]
MYNREQINFDNAVSDNEAEAVGRAVLGEGEVQTYDMQRLIQFLLYLFGMFRSRCSRGCHSSQTSNSDTNSDIQEGEANARNSLEGAVGRAVLGEGEVQTYDMQRLIQFLLYLFGMFRSRCSRGCHSCHTCNSGTNCGLQASEAFASTANSSAVNTFECSKCAAASVGNSSPTEHAVRVNVEGARHSQFFRLNSSHLRLTTLGAFLLPRHSAAFTKINRNGYAFECSFPSTATTTIVVRGLFPEAVTSQMQGAESQVLRRSSQV